MTPQQKAKQRIEHYMKLFSLYLENTIHIDEAKAIVESECDELIKNSNNYIITIRFKGCKLSDKEYWEEVKKSAKEYKPE